MWSAGEGDDNKRFLAALRALRDAAALEFDELAARAHYPSDVLKEAENGPALPTLPILAAYVRACDGDVPEWEERWRRLGGESRADPDLPVRPAGASAAATAGARAGVSVVPPDAYDPERIRAALRSSHVRSDRGGRGIAARRVGAGWGTDRATDTSRDATVGWSTGFQPDADAQPGTETNWDGLQLEADGHWDSAAALEFDDAPANGNHYASQAGDGPADAAVIEPPDAAHADAIRRDPFSTDWLQGEGALTPHPDLEPGWQAEAEAEAEAEAAAAAAAQDDWFTPREAASREQTRPAGDPGASSPAATDTWFTPRERAEPAQEQTSLAAAGVTGFWTPETAASAPAEVQRPGPLAQEHAIPQASWPTPAETPASDPPGAADRTVPVLTPVQALAAAAAPSRTMTGPAVPPGPVIPPSEPRKDRMYPVRLLVVILVAALIGSVLVLLLR